MRKKFKYYQTIHPSLLVETNKMNAVDNESDSERGKINFFYDINCIFSGRRIEISGGRRPSNPPTR
jgi:hypothetical protein